ncbi:MAG: hypothetical protein ABTD50_19350 [Polyangiaceae bacterium]|jgi:hypothetical protein
MSRATPLLLLFVASELACVAPIEPPAVASESASGCCTSVYPASRSVVDYSLVLVAVTDCTATPPASACHPYEDTPPVGSWVCDVSHDAGTLTLDDGGSPLTWCF